MKDKLCPCKSKKKYFDCCQKYHAGKTAKDAETLMRSRFSAYALGLIDYIINTSHPKNPCFQRSIKELKKEILNFSKKISFENLEITEFLEDKNQAFVTFIATLKSKGQNVSFTEISHFEKEKGKWLYKDGQMFEGRKKNI